MQMSSLGFSPLLEDIKAEFGMSYSQVGLFTGMYGLMAIAMSIPGGLLAKRFGEKRALAAGLLVTAMGICILGLAANFLTGLAGRALWIIGYRVSFVCVMASIAFTAPPSLKGSAMGILGACSSLATVFGAPFGTSLGTAFGWRTAIFGYACMAVLGAIVFFLLYRRVTNKPAPRGHHGPAAFELSASGAADSPFRNPMVWSLILLGTINMGGFSATFFVPSAVKVFEAPAAVASAPATRDVETSSTKASTSAKSKPSALATKIISTSYIFAIFANLAFGYLCDRFNRWNAMLFLCALLLPACFTMMVQNLAVFWISTAVLISLGLCATNQLYTLATELVRGKNTATVMGIASLGGGVFGYLGPQMLGYLRDKTGGFTAGWYFVAGGIVVSFAELLLLKHYVQGRKKSPVQGVEVQAQESRT
jgi:predicted MFS family arabinose efflux permease